MTKLFIKRTKDGIIRPSEWPPDSRFYWEEGNASCDCNRALAFGEEDDYQPCGEWRYELVNEDGTPFTDWPNDDENY